MFIKFPKQHKLFIFLYFLTISTLLLDTIDIFTIGIVLRKIKYIYILIMGIICARNMYFSKKQLLGIAPLIFMTIHAFLFGFIFVNKQVTEATMLHVRECFIFYVFVFVTFCYVSRTDCFFVFVEISYAALVVQLGFAAMTHISDFVNPRYYYRIFDESNRIRSSFGLVQYGYLGNYAFCALALSLILLQFKKKYKYNSWGNRIIYIIDLLIICMVCSAATRSSFISLFVLIYFYTLFELFSKMKNNAYRLLKIIVFTAVLLIFIVVCIKLGTRNLNIEGNNLAFKEIGNFWTGMGYVENHAFQTEISIYGIQTTSLDISYVYYYYTTGFIGCLILGLAAIWILVALLRKKNDSIRNIVLSIYIALLFYAYWQVCLFTYSYYSNLIYLVIYMSLIARKDCFQKEPIIVIGSVTNGRSYL